MAEMKTFLAEAGIDPAGYNLIDGSGLSRLNLVTPSTVLKLLRFMYESPAREKWLSHPAGGRPGRHAQLAFRRHRRRRPRLRQDREPLPRQRAFRLPPAGRWHLGGVFHPGQQLRTDAPPARSAV